MHPINAAGYLLESQPQSEDGVKRDTPQPIARRKHS